MWSLWGTIHLDHYLPPTPTWRTQSERTSSLSSWYFLFPPLPSRSVLMFCFLWFCKYKTFTKLLLCVKMLFGATWICVVGLCWFIFVSWINYILFPLSWELWFCVDRCDLKENSMSTCFNRKKDTGGGSHLSYSHSQHWGGRSRRIPSSRSLQVRDAIRHHHNQPSTSKENSQNGKKERKNQTITLEVSSVGIMLA